MKNAASKGHNHQEQRKLSSTDLLSLESECTQSSDGRENSEKRLGEDKCPARVEATAINPRSNER